MATTPIYALPYQSLTDPPNGPVLGQALALAVEAQLARIDAAIAAETAARIAGDAAPGVAWTTFVPTWTASAGSPSLGNGSWSAAYRQNGKTVMFRVALTGGSTSNYGTLGAYWQIGIPVGVARGNFTCAVHVLNNGVLEYEAHGLLVNGTSSVEFFGSTGRWVNNSGFVFGDTDVIEYSMTYETT